LQQRPGIAPKRTENRAVFAGILREMAEKCRKMNMSFGVKYLLESAAYAMQGLLTGRTEITARHCEQKRIAIVPRGTI
jgi:hypothetical protein